MRIALLLCVLLVASPAVAQGVDELVLSGSDAMYRGDFVQAHADFSQAVEKDPANEFALNQLGLIYARNEQFDEARKLFSHVAQLSADNVFARMWLGLLHLREDDADGALAAFRGVLTLDPGNAHALYFLGVMAGAQNRLEEAVGLYRAAAEAAASGPPDPDMHYRLARSFLHLDMPANAELEFTRVLESDPGHGGALVGLGWLTFNRGDEAAALRHWEAALGADPANSEARAALAWVMTLRGVRTLGVGGRREAAQLFERALRYEPENKAARYHLRRTAGGSTK